MTERNDQISREIASFQSVWQGGYLEGDPLDPMGPSGYQILGYMSILHATYLVCIKPYVTEQTRVLEIGPGRGAWTRCFVRQGAKAIWALDAKPRDVNGFDAYVGVADHIHYIQVADASCDGVPDDTIDYFFTFGCFCHLSPLLIDEYLTNIHRKMRSGAIGFMLIADYAQHNAVHANVGQLSIARFVALPQEMLAPYRVPLEPDASLEPAPGRWYDLGKASAWEMLEAKGFVVLDPDVGTVPRDPIIKFSKP